MASISKRENREVEAANASDNTPVAASESGTNGSSPTVAAKERVVLEQADPMALDPLSPLNPPADPWFHRFDAFGESHA